MGEGFVSADHIHSHLPKPSDDTVVLMCGPPPMIKAMEGHLQTLDFKEEMYFAY